MLIVKHRIHTIGKQEILKFPKTAVKKSSGTGKANPLVIELAKDSIKRNASIWRKLAEY